MEVAAETDTNLLDLFSREPLTLTSYQKLLREIAGRGKEIKSSPWLPELARLSLSVLECPKHYPKTSGMASTGCHFNKAVVNETIHMFEIGKGSREILQRLEEVFRDYALIAAAPLVAIRNPDHSLRNQLLETFISVNFRKGYRMKPNQVFATAYHHFNQNVREESLAIQQGIIGELFAYLFLKQAGYSPALSMISEDLEGTDFYLVREDDSKVPIQIKTSLHFKEELFLVSTKEGSPNLFIFLNPEGILENPNIVKALFGEETPGKSCIISFAEKIKDVLTKFYPSQNPAQK